MKLRKKSQRVLLPFVITLGALVGIFLVGILFIPGGNSFQTRHIPSNLPAYAGLLGAYAPADALQVSYNNFTAIRGINSTALSSGNYLVFKEPKLNISASSIQQRISVVLIIPNATVDITVLNRGVFEDAYTAFNRSSLPRTQVGSFLLFSGSEVSTVKPVAVVICMLERNSSLIYSQGTNTAQAAVGRVLAVYEHTVTSLITGSETQRLFYVANGTLGHLAVGIQNYAGAVTSGQMTLITVNEVKSHLAINHMVSFANSSLAGSQMGYFKKVYLGADIFEAYDEVLVASQIQPLSALTKAVTFVG